MKKVLMSFMLVILGVICVSAQTTAGRLSGTVSSPDGVLPGATVTITFTQTGKELTTTTNESGNFIFPQLEPGDYLVKVTAGGFKTYVAESLKIDVAREYTLNPTLELGEVQETVTVTAGADVVTSTTAQVSSTVSPQQILSLPLITRDPLNLTTQQAGVASNPNQNTSINGMRTTMTNITRDGISINDQFIRTNATDFAPGRPSVDDTGEFTLATTNQDSDLGSGGAQIILVTPRGTRDFHGALFAYNRNSEFAANTFFNNRTGVERPFRNRNQYGGKIGGPFPILRFGEGGPIFEKNKGFFFFAYEGIKDPLSARATRTILTPSARTGVFQFNRATAGSAINTGGISCPSGAAGSVCTVSNILAFAQAQGLSNIPTTIDPVIQQRVLGVLPAQGNTTGIGDGLNTTGFALNRRQDQTRDTFTTRIDIDATDKDSVNGVFSYNSEENLRPDVDTTGFSEVPEVSQLSTNKTFTLAYRRIITDTIVNEVRGGIFTSEVPFVRTSPIPSYFIGPSGTTSTTLAGIISQPDNIFLDQGRNNKLFSFGNNLSVVLGKHSLKFGGQYQKYKVNSYNDVLIVPNYIIGAANAGAGNSTTLSTANFQSLISTTQLATANSLLAILGGIYNGATQGFNTTSPTSGYSAVRNLAPFRNSNHALYASDKWSVFRGLTLSLGLRYELFPALKIDNGLALEPVISDPSNPVASLINGNGSFNVVGTNAGKDRLYYKTDYNNFAPNIGVAYSLPTFESGIGKILFGSDGRSVIRGGYSHIYGNDSIITSLNGTLTGNLGLGRATNSPLGPSGTTALNGRLGSGVVPIAAPTFVTPPRSFLQNNTAGQGFFGVANAVDPELQIPKVEQYSFGFQREFFGNTAFEVRYVGSRSDNLTRGIDLNQIDIINNGFINDFQRAQNNLSLNIAERTRRINACVAGGGTTATCTTQVNTALPLSAAFNSTLTGSVPLTLIPLIGTLSGTRGGIGAITTGGSAINATVLANLQNGAVADLAQYYVTQNVNNQPTLASPNLVPFINFYPNPNIGQIELFTNAGSYYYNSLQMEIRRRFSQGLYFQANYTFSKNLTDTIGTSQQLFEPYLQNQNPDLDYQRADFDQTHVFNLNGIYQLPFGKGKMFLNQGGIIDKIFGGFELSGLLNWSSGAPITFVDTRGTLNRTARSTRQTPFTNLTNAQIRALGGVFQANGNIYFVNPSIIDPNTGRASNGYINGSNSNTAFNGQAFFNVEAGQTGNTARTIINGPKYFNVNMALLKNINFSESIRLQLRAEAFNLLNNVNFINNAQFANINSAAFGQITSSFASRQMQFAARFEF